MTYQLKESFLHRSQYNAQANRGMFEILSGLTGKARRRDCGSYFGSIWGIINHLVNAEYIWLNRFKPLMPEATIFMDTGISPDNLSWYENLCESFDELKKNSAYISGMLSQWFKEYPEENYGKSFQYQDSAGAMRDAVAGKAFDYLLLHQIHHRGQISQILDEIGLPNNFADNGFYLEM